MKKILPFAQELNGKPFYAVEKIWKGLIDTQIFDPLQLPSYAKYTDDTKGKLHTIRTAGKYQVGDELEMWVSEECKTCKGKGVQSKLIMIGTLLGVNDKCQKCQGKGYINTYQFAPIVKCTGVQKDTTKEIIHWTELTY